MAANGGLANSTGKAREQMVTMRQQIIDNAVAHGIDRAAVTSYIDKLMQIPKSVPPTKLDVETANALAKTAQLKKYIASLQGETVWLTTHVNSIYSGVEVLAVRRCLWVAPIYRQGGGPVTTAQYLAYGGHASGPRGTDTVTAWLTPGESVIRRSSAQSIGQPALNYRSQTGKLPPSAAPNIAVYVTNPFTGEQVQAVAQYVASGVTRQMLQRAGQDAKNRRPGQ